MEEGHKGRREQKEHRLKLVLLVAGGASGGDKKN